MSAENQMTPWESMIAELEGLPPLEQIDKLIDLSVQGVPPAIELFLEHMSSLDPAVHRAMFDRMSRRTDIEFWKLLLEFCATGLWRGMTVTIAPPSSPLNRSLRLQAKALCLSDVSPEVRAAQVEALLDLLDSPERETKYLAAELLGELGTSEAIQKLLRTLDEEDPKAKVAVLNALGKIGGTETLDIIKKHLYHPHKDVHKAAADALGSIGPGAIPVLKEATEDSDDHIRWHAAKALQQIHDERVVPIFISLLDDPNYGVRWLAVEGLASLGEAVVPPLLEKLSKEETNLWFRQSAFQVLNRVAGPELRKRLEKLMDSMKHPESAAMIPLYAKQALDAVSKMHLAKIKAEKKPIREPYAVQQFPAGRFEGEEEVPSLLLPLQFNPYRCYHCGGASPTENPSPADVCPYCGYHLRTCYNCVYYENSGCLLNQPYVISSAVPGNRCPHFRFKKTEIKLQGLAPAEEK
jgi:HEAT repeat protein